MSSNLKEWLWLTFFPQEDAGQLLAIRNNLTPFLKTVTKVLSIELEREYVDKDDKNALFAEVLQNLPAENSTSNFSINAGQLLDTLEFEFDQLLNLRSVLLNFPKKYM